MSQLQPVLDTFDSLRPYRLVQESDLVPGQELFMVELDALQRDAYRPLDRIKLDVERPVEDRGYGTNVYYYCTQPAWDVQCFVPIEDFLCQQSDLWGAFLYLLPRDS